MWRARRLATQHPWHKTVEAYLKHARDTEMDYWVSKCHRQRMAINLIQRKGWYPPAYVIQEEPV